MTIKIRPHHLTQFSKEELHYGTVDAVSGAKLREVYGPESVEHIENLLARVKAGEELEIVSGQDDICSACRFNPYCSVKNYKPVKEAINAFYNKYRLKVSDRARSIENNPDTADARLKAHHKLKDGQKLSKKELVGMYDPNSI